MNLQTLLDERAIMHGLGRFARILDGREWGMVSDVFADDVTFNYGDGRDQAGIAAMTKQFRDFLGGCGPSQHLLGSTVITVEGDKGTSNAYVQASHQGKDGKEDLYLYSHGEYIDQWERRAEGWRIVRRDVRWFFNRGDMSVLAPG